MEYMEKNSLKGEMNNKYKANTKYTEKELLKLVYEVLQGLIHLKKLGISHRDISPDNILIDA
jgi:serine/threonine protein kinase